MTDYTVYTLSRAQLVSARLGAACIGFAAVWLLYREPLIALLAVPLGLYGPKLLSGYLRRKRQERLRLQFKDMLQTLSSLLSAGRSVDNAFAALEEDMALLVGDPDAPLLREIRAVVNRLRNGEPLEQSLGDLAVRSGLEEIGNFAEAFRICKRAGGDLVEVMRRTSQLIGEKLEVELEVSVLIAQKKFESKLMMAMPFGFVGLLGFFAADYMQPLYRGGGLLVLTVCLLALAAVCLWMKRIMDIRL
ncbi:type II secretion system F family protein [Cohnella sp. 56]|uniref:type II secretion system F family protein n=1 Tax=Cohnella sp. 56 TaxID=3113722 RepID=UPI0030EA9983